MSEGLPIIRTGGLRASRIVSEPQVYLEASSEGSTRIVEDLSTEKLNPDCSYRQIHYHNAPSQIDHSQSEDLYCDYAYTIDLQTDFPSNEVIVRRLSTCYGVTNRPAFLDPILDPTRQSNGVDLPHCLVELPMFDFFHYRGLFITQDFNPLGRYELILNIEGRFERVVVDDRIPVNKHTLEPIWGLSYQKPWELILFKAYAKVKQGYAKAALARPFEFTETVTNSPWKYFNLTKESDRFLKKYRDSTTFRRGRIILKTKNSQEVKNAGLLHNSASYTLLAIKSKDENNMILTIRGTANQNWSGSFSLQDGKYVEQYKLFRQDQEDTELTVERDFMMTHHDVLNYFSSAYVTSLRKGQYFTGYKVIEIADEEKKAQYLEFFFPSKGFIDISIRQFSENLVKAGAQSSIALTSVSELGPQRYVKTKHIIVKDTHFKNPSALSETEKREEEEFKKSNIRKGHVYAETRFEIFEIDYMKGYGKCDAFFLELERGKYIMRFKSEFLPKTARYAISWVASNQIEIHPSYPSETDKVDLLEDAMVSKMHRVDHLYLAKEHAEMLCKADSFEELGYGFMAVKTTKDCQYSIQIRVNPRVLHEEGYALKGKWKGKTEEFEIDVGPLKYASVVFKKRRGANNYVPFVECKGANFWKKRVLGLGQLSHPIIQVGKEEDENN